MSLVYDTNLFKNRNEQETIWTLSSVLTQRIQTICPIASLSNVYMDLKTNGVIIKDINQIFLFLIEYYFQIDFKYKTNFDH